MENGIKIVSVIHILLLPAKNGQSNPMYKSRFFFDDVMIFCTAAEIGVIALANSLVASGNKISAAAICTGKTMYVAHLAALNGSVIATSSSPIAIPTMSFSINQEYF